MREGTVNYRAVTAADMVNGSCCPSDNDDDDDNRTYTSHKIGNHLADLRNGF